MTPNELPAPTGAPVPRPTPRQTPPAQAAAAPGATAPTATTTPRPSAAAARPTGAPAPRPGTPAKSRPDPRPMRLGLGAAAIAALTVMIGGMVRFPATDPAAVADDGYTADVQTAQAVQVEKRIRYVQLKKGEKAPPGAKVIDSAQPTPRVIVTRIQQPAPVTHKKVTRTKQSGRH